MKRRGFLKLFGIGAPVAAALGLSHLIPEAPAKELPQYMPFMPQLLKSDDVIDPLPGWVSYKFHFKVSERPSENWRRIRNIES